MRNRVSFALQLSVLVLWLFATAALAANKINFHAATYPPTPFKIKLAQKQGVEFIAKPGLLITGTLNTPQGAGPFPAVILMHGCTGIQRWNRVWTERLVEWGYVVLDVDSFGPRGEHYICDRPLAVSDHDRALDAYGAKAYLASQTYIEPTRIAVLGMSHGGWSVLRAVEGKITDQIKTAPFGAAIALYPYCDESGPTNTPLLILIGERDDWTPVERCERFVSGHSGKPTITMHVYPEAHHVFDLPGIDTTEQGHVMRYNEAAAEDAVMRVREFLTDNLL